MTEEFSWSEFIGTLANEFTKFSGSDDANATYSNEIYNEFLGKMAGTSNECESSNKEVVYVDNDSVLCSVFNYDITKSRLLLINTALNVIMLLVSFIVLAKRNK